MNITELEATALRAIYEDDFQDGRQDQPGNTIWLEIVMDTLANEAPRKTWPGVFSSLNKKGLIYSDSWSGRDSGCSLTQAGIDQIKQLS